MREEFEMSIEEDEDGFGLVIEGEAVFGIANPEALYDQVKARIGPWLRERDEARFERHVGRVFACDPDESAGAYELSDPKHPRHRDAFEVFSEEDR